MSYRFSNEIVFRGHPDKVCDQISAAILQQALAQDRSARAGIEVMGGKGNIFVTGEVSTTANLDIAKIVKEQLSYIGYDPDSCHVIDNLGRQSPDIAQGVDKGGAGDQGVMYGFATAETEEMLPRAQVILQELASAYDRIRQTDSRFLPDGKAQITGLYDEDTGRLLSILDLVVSYQNTEEERPETDAMLRALALALCDKHGVSVERIHFNPTGRFERGGFDADAGLTGRKIVVDSYQGFARVGGGCMNGKDPTKVDLSGAHKARQIACSLVRYGFDRAEVQLSYAIGMEHPLSVVAHVVEDGVRGTLDMTVAAAEECTPRRMTETLHLLDADYVELARYGHFRRAI